jgi:hypothetical protein
MALRVLRSTLSSSLAAAALSSSSCVRREMYLGGRTRYTTQPHSMGVDFIMSRKNKSYDIVPLRINPNSLKITNN